MKNTINFSLVITILLAAILGCSSTSKERTQIGTNQSNVAVVLNKSESSPSSRSYADTLSAKPKTNSAVVISEHANLRDSDNGDASVIGQIARDSSVEVIKQQGGWFYVKSDTGLQGWMHGNTLRLERYETSKPSKNPSPVYVPDQQKEISEDGEDTPSGSREYITGPRGGCYYINGNGNKTYVARSMCGGATTNYQRKVSLSSSGGYIRGPRGGCYYITGGGRKQYVDRNLCN